MTDPRDEVSITWHIDDVKSIDDTLTDEQCRDVLEMAKNQHDAEWGMNWGTLRIHVDEVKKHAKDIEETEPNEEEEQEKADEARHSLREDGVAV